MTASQTPPIFKRGLPPLLRLFLFVSAALLLSLLDLRLRYLDNLRHALSVVTYPLQIAARAPGDVVNNLASYFADQNELQQENQRLHQSLLKASLDRSQLELLTQENERLRTLLSLGQQIRANTVVASILYAARDPFSHKVVLSKGTAQGIEAGQVVMDESGIVGQVTRAFPLLSEVTLLTDRNQAIPVRVQRNGLRAMLFGAGSGRMELRYLPANVDVQPGDYLVTSGLDGVYVPGLPVASVLSVSREEAQSFARIYCQPIAGVENYGEVLVVSRAQPAPERPPEPPVPGSQKKPKRGAAPVPTVPVVADPVTPSAPALAPAAKPAP